MAALQRFRPHPGDVAVAEPKPQVEVEPMGIMEYRRMLYDATANGWPVEKAGQLVRQIQQETPDMYTSAFEPGTPEFERYYELRRSGKSRREAFGAVLKEIDVDNPDDALTAREIQEGREAVMVPGDRQSFHTSNEAEAPSEGSSAEGGATTYPTRREAMQADIDAAVRRDKAVEAAKEASAEVKSEAKATSKPKQRPVSKKAEASSSKS